MKLRRACLYVILLIGGFSGFADNSGELTHILENISSTFTDYYAPREWKKEQFGWNLEAEIKTLEESVRSGEKISQFHENLKQFFIKTRDYHTGIYFSDTSTSSIPIGIKYIDGDFYLAYMDSSIPPSFPLMLGDKITHFNNIEVKEVAYNLMGRVENPKNTDWALAAKKLTNRVGISHDKMEKGSVIIKADREGVSVFGQLVWNYNANLMNFWKIKARKIKTPIVADVPEIPEVHEEIKDSMRALIEHIESRPHKVAFADHMKQAALDKASNPLTLGAKESFLPKLGNKVVWTAEKDSRWQAYIYMNGDNKLIGFIRLPTFAPSESDYAERAKEFGEIIKKMEELTDALIIDQQNNPGGSIFYLYALLSMLSDQPLKNPHHRFTIDSKEVWQAHEMIKKIDLAIKLLPLLGDSLGDMHGYPINQQFFLHMKSYFQFIVEQWQDKKTLTDPYFLYGVDYIQPHPEYNYTKKIVVLTNELDFSAADFFPAILQDSGRAIIMGNKTAGAGGYVLSNADRNRVGVMQYTYTGSHALRADGKPLEDNGVTPDVPYGVTPEDLKTRFLGFRIVINAIVSALINI